VSANGLYVQGKYLAKGNCMRIDERKCC